MKTGKAYLYSSLRPDERQEKGFAAFLKNRYQQDLELIWVNEPELDRGFRLEVGNDIYDWSPEGLFRQFRKTVERRSSKKYPQKNIFFWVCESPSSQRRGSSKK